MSASDLSLAELEALMAYDAGRARRLADDARGPSAVRPAAVAGTGDGLRSLWPDAFRRRKIITRD